MVQDIKELIWAGIVKECFLMFMRLDLIFERICGIEDFIYIPLGKILRKLFSLKRETYYKEVLHEIEDRILSSFHPTQYSPYLSLIFLHSAYQHLA